MTAIEFPEQTLVLAKDQPEYIPLPVHIDPDDTMFPVTACFKLNEQELKEVAETGMLWLTQCTFGRNFHPVRISTAKPTFRTGFNKELGK